MHVASIEVSSHDMVKTDKRDSLKIREQLAAGRLRRIDRILVEEGKNDPLDAVYRNATAGEPLACPP